jgi:hypothetical protein
MVNRCPCGFLAKTPAGLASHKRRAHPETGGENRKAAERFLTELRRMGRIESVDCARVQTVRGISDALDADSSNAALWKVYRDTIEDLMRQDDDANDALSQAVASINRAAALGNAPES